MEIARNTSKGACLTQQHFGSRLAEARRRRGLTLDQVHRQLRITPGILDALELADFRHMPFKGHSRNMVSSYARYLGLDPEDVTKQFLREYHEYENREARVSSSPYGLVGKDPFSREEPKSFSRNTDSEASQSTRSIWDRPIPNTELGRGYHSRPSLARRMTAPPPDRPPRIEEGPVSHRLGAGGFGTGGLGSGGLGVGSHSARQSLPLRLFSSLFKSPIAVIVTLIVVLVLLLVLWALAANSCKQEETPITPINTTKVNDTPANGTDGEPGPNNNTETTPDQNSSEYGPFELVIEPVSGEAPWLEVSVDGEDVFYEILYGRQTWQVTDRCTIFTAQPYNTIVTRNGEAVTLNIDSNTGGGTVSLNVLVRPSG